MIKFTFPKPEPKTEPAEENPPETVLSDLPVEEDISIKEEFDPDSILSPEQHNSEKEVHEDGIRLDEKVESENESSTANIVPPMYRRYAEGYDPIDQLERPTFKISRRRKGRRSSFLNMKMKKKSLWALSIYQLQEKIDKLKEQIDTPGIEETDGTPEEPPENINVKPEPQPESEEENPPETVLSDLVVEEDITIKEEFDPDAIMSSEQQNCDNEMQEAGIGSDKKVESANEASFKNKEPYKVPPMYKKYVEQYEPFAYQERATFKVLRGRKGRRSSFLNKKRR